jgi:c-di-GMP-binding flagellar brake protein YcgR
MKREQRRYARADAKWLVIIKARDDLVTGQTINISAGGAFICCQGYIEEAAKVQLSIIDVPFLNRPLPVMEEVIRSNIHCVENSLRPYGIGIRFINIAKEDQKLISAVVSGDFKAQGIDNREEESEK